MRIRWLSFKNATQEAWHKSPLICLGLGAMGAALFCGVGIGFTIFYGVAAASGFLIEAVYSVYYFLLLFLFAGAVPFVATTLLHSSDYALLFNAPTPPRTVIAAKLLDATITNSLQFFVLGIPAMAATAFALQLPVLGWLLLPLLIALFALLPALLTALALLILLAIMGIARLRSILTVLNGLMAIVVCCTIVVELNYLPKFGQLGKMAMQGSPPPVHASTVAHLAPSSWTANVFVNFSLGEPVRAVTILALLTTAVALLFAICVVAGEKLLRVGEITEETGSGRIDSAEEGNTKGLILKGPLKAMMRKDWLYLKRDPMLLSQIAMPALLYTLPFFLKQANPSLRSRDELFPLSITMIATLVFMQTSILSLSSVGIEGRGFWITVCAPNSTHRILQAKWWLTFLFTGTVSGLMTIASSIAFHAEPILAAGVFWVILCSCAALSGLGVGISAIFPRFITENPAHRVSFWALTLGFIASFAYLAITGTIFLVTWYVTIQPTGLTVSQSWTLAFLLFTGGSAYATLAPVALGARRLEAFEWEH